MVKSSGVQRESEGVVVPAIGVQHNAPGGKGPHFGHAGGEGKRKGMTGVSRSNHPDDGHPHIARGPVRNNVRELQRKLWTAAKQSPGRRFHALYDRIHRDDVLWRAWVRVRENRGAAGVDRVTLDMVEEYGVHRFIDELRADLQNGMYRPAPARRVEIPKSDGGRRPLSIPAVRDRVAQQAARIVIEPIFEADFLDVSYGFRPKRSTLQAMEEIRVHFPRGYQFVAEADIRDFFGQIDHGLLMREVERRISDRRVLKLIRKWLQAGVLDGGEFRRTLAGTPQGGVISPLLANVYLHAFDREMVARGVGVLVRYCDDFVVLCRSRRQAEAALRAAEEILGGLGLQLHPGKTRVIDCREGRDGFDFLGCLFHARMSGRLWERKRIRRYYLHRWPSQRAMKRLREKIRGRTGRDRAGRDIRDVIADINPVLRGWSAYFRTGNAGTKFRQVDSWVFGRLYGLMCKKRGRNLHARHLGQWTTEWFYGHGLFRLTGTIQYPKTA